MAKKGMRRPDPRKEHGTESNKKLHIPKNAQNPVDELDGKQKNRGRKAKPL